MSRLSQLTWPLRIGTGLVAIVLLAYICMPQVISSLGPQADENQNKCTKIGVEGDPDSVARPNPGVVKLIQIADDGRFVDRCQFTDMMYELNWDVPKLFGPKVKQDAANLPRLAVLYIHGWKHGAESNDSDLVAFNNIIETLQDTHKGRKQILGIYISWKASYGLGVFENLSFWSKKNVADRISQSAVVTKIVSAISNVRRRDRDNLDQFIAIGHSFGARILFNAINQLLVYETSRSHPGAPGREYEIIFGSADAVILLNPAFEASIYAALDSFGRYEERFSRNQAPLLISIATENDWATTYAFPVAQWLGMLRTDLEMTTLGNFEQYWTHFLCEIDDINCLHEGKHVGLVQNHPEESGLRLVQVSPIGTKMGRNRVLDSNNPFLVVRTTKEVIDGHNGIWNDKFSKWMLELINDLERSHQRQADKIRLPNPSKVSK